MKKFLRVLAALILTILGSWALRTAVHLLAISDRLMGR